MSDLLPCVERETEGPAAGSVVWLHGLGASGHDFEDIVPLLGLPRVRFVFPHAPQRGVTINGGLIMPAWYDILSLEGQGPGDEAGIRASAAHVEALLAREEARGVARERIVLAGFSQGAAMALHVGLRSEKPLAGIMVLSGYEVLAERQAAEASAAARHTPVLFCHGLFDPVVRIERGREAYDVLVRAGQPAAWYAFPMGHEVCLEEIQVIRTWLGERFAPQSIRR
jgi:phospholipase/carboxylesterase